MLVLARKIGETILIGEATFTLVKVVSSEPDHSVLECEIDDPVAFETYERTSVLKLKLKTGTKYAVEIEGVIGYIGIKRMSKSYYKVGLTFPKRVPISRLD